MRKRTPKKPELRRTYLREWREFRGLTQEQAAERFGIDRSHLSKVERRQVPYSQGLIEAAADAYNCEPRDILGVNPFMAGELIDLTVLLGDADPLVRADIIGYAKGRLKLVS